MPTFQLLPDHDLAEIVESLCPMPIVDRNTCQYLRNGEWVTERITWIDFEPGTVSIGMMGSGLLLEDLPHEIKFRKGEADVRAKMVKLEWAAGWQAWYQFEGVARV